ncbi:Uncharacterized protein APZ42_026633 [Daphnia magna]|uniref:Uncharacterized protein n=1 Tax=Daphnia magna TaxID=35525 RepID=A0A164S2B0_9CRUS|nr:Uncharacterized protein APZ42_026633 [Daphnia magna]
MQWSGWLLVIGLLLLWTTSAASASNASPRELKALRAALKKQQRIKDQLLQQQQQQQQQQQHRSSSSAGAGGKGASIGGSGEYVPDAGPWSSSSMDANKEPSCEQLRHMWRQSKRHSRAAEATNEIPQYADPFARATSLHYARQLQNDFSSGAEPTLRPRQERRPVIYGRLHSSPSAASDGQEGADRPARPFDVLRKLSWTESSADAASAPSESINGQGRSGSAVVLYGEEERSPFPKSPAKGSLQHLRELVREEQGRQGGVKGSFQQLRDIVREEKSRNDQQQGRASPSSRTDWSDADVGRVVTSPADHASKHLLFAMQGDAPYDSGGSSGPSPHQPTHARRPSNSNNYSRLSSFGKSHHRNHNSQSANRQQGMNEPPDLAAVAAAAAASRKSFQLRDPPRPRISSSRLLGSQRAASANANKWTSSSSFGGPDSDDDVGVVRGYVVAKGGVKALYSPSKPNRRSLTTAEEDDDDCGDEVVDTCRSHSDCRCAAAASSVQQRCQRGRCVPLAKNGGQKRQRNHQKRQPPPTSMRRRRLEDDERELSEDEWTQSDQDEPDPSRLEQLLQEDQQSEDETSHLWQEEHRSRPNSRKAETIRDIIDALQQIDQQESTD